MDMTENFLRNNGLHDADDIDALIELADLTRTLIAAGQVEDLNRLLRYTIERSYPEAFSWCAGILEEEFGQDPGALTDFTCELGRSIPNYDDFTARLQVDLEHPRNDHETVCDRNGEVTSFFNILAYKTGYDHICFVSCENFDTKDNDYVQYRLQFSRH